MSLRHALIGLLAEQPASGWDLTRRFEDLLGTVWPAGHPQIYGELRKLEADGFIEIDSKGPRRRKTYRATPAGIEEVRRWLTAVEVDHTLRLEPVLRSVFFWLMTPEELAVHLEKEAAFYHELAEKYRAIAAAKDSGEYGDSPQTGSIRIAAEAGVRLHQALGDWATWTLDRQQSLAPRHEALAVHGRSASRGVVAVLGPRYRDGGKFSVITLAGHLCTLRRMS